MPSRNFAKAMAGSPLRYDMLYPSFYRRSAVPPFRRSAVPPFHPSAQPLRFSNPSITQTAKPEIENL